MNIPDSNEEVPYRVGFDPTELKEDLSVTPDEEHANTLKIVHTSLRDEIRKLHGFNVFDLHETDLKIKQQIKVHQMVADVLEPLYETVTQALAAVDQRYKQRNNL